MVVWVDEHTVTYVCICIGENRVEQTIPLLFSLAGEPLIHAALILTPLRKCGPLFVAFPVWEVWRNFQGVEMLK